ncbi:MAG: hypothetical protein NTZ97_04230 [Candidatus Moranbacteria bacterium]|nr:hypothetical protein [Candidatus Moranbacteria bacterium]
MTSEQLKGMTKKGLISFLKEKKDTTNVSGWSRQEIMDHIVDNHLQNCIEAHSNYRGAPLTVHAFA